MQIWYGHKWFPCEGKRNLNHVLPFRSLKYLPTSAEALLLTCSIVWELFSLEKLSHKGLFEVILWVSDFAWNENPERWLIAFWVVSAQPQSSIAILSQSEVSYWFKETITLFNHGRWNSIDTDMCPAVFLLFLKKERL